MTSERSQAYGRVMQTIADLGPAKLHPSEQDRIRDAADALLFCEDATAAAEALVDIRALTGHLVESGRWLDESAERLLGDLEDAGPMAPVS
jgi:hypothetical protein